MNTKLATLLVLLSTFNLLVFAQDASKYEIGTRCAEEVNVEKIFGSQAMYFTVPSKSDEPTLDLWIADNSGTNFSGLSFQDFDLLEANPSGNYVMVASRQYEYGSERGIFDFQGSIFSEYRLVDMTDLSIEILLLPPKLYEIQFMSSITWVDDTRAAFISIQNQVIAILDVLTQKVELLEWPEDVYLPYPSGYLSLSPDGSHILHTISTPSITDADENPDTFLAWRIVEMDGNLELGYVDGIGNTARWMPDSSGIIVSDRDNHILQIDLQGEITTIIEEIAEYVLVNPLVNNNGTYIAFTGFSRNGNLQSLIILDRDNHQLVDSCQEAIQIEKGLWSPNGNIIAFRLGNRGNTQIALLDVESNQVSYILPYQPKNDSIGAGYIKIIGWKK